MFKILHLLFVACLKYRHLSTMAYRALHHQAPACLINLISHCFTP